MYYVCILDDYDLREYLLHSVAPAAATIQMAAEIIVAAILELYYFIYFASQYFSEYCFGYSQLEIAPMVPRNTSGRVSCHVPWRKTPCELKFRQEKDEITYIN